jgi:deazaflavin-dependent oxidoreductase (nitroreductase family)
MCMSDWNTNIIEEFRANEGRVGGPFEGAPMILIHHIGAKSGTERVAPLVYFAQDDGSLVIVASKAGAPTNPDWYHNLKANPSIDVEVGTETFPVTVEEVVGDERETLWKAVVTANPGFGEYQEKTTRTLPLLRLVRQG